MQKILTIMMIFASLSVSAQKISDYNVKWTTPSENSSGSMPIGNGEVGANVWVEPNGDIVFYIARTDALNETGELFKLGRVRVSITPSLTSGGDFAQTLDLGKGRIRVSGGGTALDFFIDSDADVIYLTGKAGKPVDVKVAAEVWRDHQYEITPAIAADCFRSISGFPEGEVHFTAYPDFIASGVEDITVYHHNCESSYEATLQLENLQPENRALHDPFLNRAFGYQVTMAGAEKADDLTLTASTKKIDIKIATLSGIFPDRKDWESAIKTASDGALSAKAACRRTAKWWKKFWDRSYIYVQTPDGETGRQINEAYACQRWIQAGSGRGNLPIKFNGTLFTVDPEYTNPEQPFGPDYRRWGGDFWWQNTRLPYHPMLKSGDFDMMKPLFEHYFRNLDVMKANAKALCGAEGALSPETQTVFGCYCPSDFHWNRSEYADNIPGNMYIRYHWDSSVEMIALMLDYWDYTGDSDFVKSRLVPYAKEMLTFYDSFYKRGDDGKLRITPTQSLETYWYDVVNDMATVAGLTETTARLQKLPAELSSDEDKALWKRLSDCMPDLPTTVRDGKTVFHPAEECKYSSRSNVENPELYTVWPFHFCNVATDNLQIGIDTFHARVYTDTFGWYQDGQQAARLGLTDEAKEILLKKLTYQHEGSRFPAMWGPNFDWVPDQDHGSGYLTTLQEMVLQTYDGVDYVLPAFPSEWGVKYKLHSFGGKTVKGAKKMQ